MIDEVVELSQVAEDVGFDAVCFPEHHLHSEGIEIGSLPVLTQHVIHNTKRIKVGPIGYVLPGWNPLRLALEIAWLDQLTKGRTFVGFARGYQTRWLNQMAQKIHVSATTSDKSETDRINREAFEEVFQFLKLAWGDEPFRFKGKYYEYPYPQEGTPWPAHEWTREYRLPRRSRRAGADSENQCDSQALPAAASAIVPGLFGQRGDRPLVRTGGNHPHHPDAPTTAGAEVRRGIPRGIAQSRPPAETWAIASASCTASIWLTTRSMRAKSAERGMLRRRLPRILPSFRIFRGLARA